jgi:hypothetical protein
MWDGGGTAATALSDDVSRLIVQPDGFTLTRLCGNVSIGRMAKRTDPPPPPTPPTFSRDEGKRRLEHMRDKAKTMSSNGIVSDEAAETWANTTLDYIKQTFGSATPHAYTFLGQMQVRMGGYGDNQRAYEVQNAHQCLGPTD